MLYLKKWTCGCVYFKDPHSHGSTKLLIWCQTTVIVSYFTGSMNVSSASKQLKID